MAAPDPIAVVTGDKITFDPRLNDTGGTPPYTITAGTTPGIGSARITTGGLIEYDSVTP